MLKVTIRGVGTPKGFTSGERTAAQWEAGEVPIPARLVCGRVAEDLPVGAVLQSTSTNSLIVFQQHEDDQLTGWSQCRIIQV